MSISHNPAPNLYLGSGIPPIPESLATGVNVSIGTDGAASNNSTDMLESMKLAALIQKEYTEMRQSSAQMISYTWRRQGSKGNRNG